MILLFVVLLGFFVVPIIVGLLVCWLMERLRVSQPKLHSVLWTSFFLVSGCGVLVAVCLIFFSGLGVASAFGGGGGGPGASIRFPSGFDFFRAWMLVGSLIVFHYLIGKGRPS